MRAGSGLWQIVLVLLFNRKDFCGPVYLKASYKLLSQCVLEFKPRDLSPWDLCGPDFSFYLLDGMSYLVCLLSQWAASRDELCVSDTFTFTHFAQQPWCQALHLRPSAMKMTSKSHMSQLYTSGWKLVRHHLKFFSLHFYVIL